MALCRKFSLLSVASPLALEPGHFSSLEDAAVGAGLVLVLRHTFSLLLVVWGFGRSLETVVEGVRSDSLLNLDDLELGRVPSPEAVDWDDLELGREPSSMLDTYLRELSERLGVYPDPDRVDPVAADVAEGRSLSFVDTS